MSRLTGTDAKNLMEAYSEVYAPQEEISEEQVWEEVENWVNSLVEEGYDLSEYTWEEMYESYLNEAPLPAGNFQQTQRTGRASSSTRTLYRSSSDGKVYRNYNDALAAKNSRDRAARTASANEKMFKAGGGNAAIPQSARQNTRGGGQTIDPAAIERVRQQGFQNLMRQRQQQAPAAQPPRQQSAPARPAAPAPARPAAPAPARPAATTPAAGTQKPAPATTPAASTSTAAAPARPSLASQAAELRQMRARSLERQGKPLSAAVVSATAKPTAFQANSFDPFDVIKGHLLDEGYADTEESALAIMTNMSETWKEEILERVLGEDAAYDRNRRRAAQRAAARNQARKEGKTGNVPGVGYVSPRPERETYTDSAGVERHTSGARMPKKDS